MMREKARKFFAKFQNLSLDIVLPLFFLSLALEMAHFFPTLGQINVWDEASYIHKGFLILTKGQWPQLASSPLTSLMYSLTMLPVLHSRNFFMLSNAIARIFLFTLIFLCVYLIARELKPYANPWIMIALVVIVPVATTMYLFPSDVLFAGLAGLGFWQMLAFYHRRKTKHLYGASFFMGIGMLARAEGLLLIGVMLITTFLLVFRKRGWIRDVLAVLLPFAAVIFHRHCQFTESLILSSQSISFRKPFQSKPKFLQARRQIFGQQECIIPRSTLLIFLNLNSPMLF